MVPNGWLEESFDNITNQTTQNSTEPNILIVFYLFKLKPNL